MVNKNKSPFKTPLNIVIAEDNVFLAQAIIEKLSFFEAFNFCYKAKNGQDLINKLEKDPLVDLILMDIQMPEMNGIVATEIIKNKYPQITIVMLTVFDDDENIFDSIKAGANGYLLKEIDAESLYKSIIEVMAGGAVMTPSVALKALNLLRHPITENEKDKGTIELTMREQDVLVQLSKGLSYKDIGKNLFISYGTVRKHIENIYRKLQVHNKIAAIQKAKKNRLI